MSSEEVCSVVKQSLFFLDGQIPSLTDHVLHSETVHPEAMAKELHRKLRCSLSVPMIYTTLKLMERLLDLADMQKKAIDDGDTVCLPKSTTHVDYTIKKILRKWSNQIAKYVHSNSDFQEQSWDPHGLVLTTLREIVNFNLGKFFGI